MNSFKGDCSYLKSDPEIPRSMDWLASFTTPLLEPGRSRLFGGSESQGPEKMPLHRDGEHFTAESRAYSHMASAGAYDRLQQHAQLVSDEEECTAAVAGVTISIKEEGHLGLQVVKVEAADDQAFTTATDKQSSEGTGCRARSVNNGRCHGSSPPTSVPSPHCPLTQQQPAAAPEQDKKQRREIANSNERRRMMCINNGFVSLQMILPKHYMKRGEKMSKAAVLQSTVDYISKLVMENAKLQTKNDVLMQKVQSARLDSTGESSDEGISVAEHEPDQTVASAKDLVTMVQHWREKYSRERCLRAQAIEEFRRLINDLQYCPAGCSKRETYNAALLRRSKSPTPDNDDDFMGPFTQSEEAARLNAPSSQQQDTKPDLTRPSSDLYNILMAEEREAPCLTPPEVPQPNSGKPRKNKPRNPAAAMLDVAKTAKQPLTGFEILYQAITFSENMDGSKSDSGCSEETFDSSEPPKKRRRSSAAVSHGQNVVNMERVCS